MTRKALTILLAAVAAVAVGAVLLATSLSGGHSSSMHTMPDGQKMDGSAMTGGHTMSDGTAMSGSGMKMP